MTAIVSEQGKLIKVLSEASMDGTYGFHRLFGFISEEACAERMRMRKGHGLRLSATGGWLCRFQMRGGQVAAVEGCAVEAMGNAWKLLTSFGQFSISDSSPAHVFDAETQEEKDSKTHWIMIGLAALIIMTSILLFSPDRENVAPEIIEPVTVTVIPEMQKAVSVPTPTNVMKELVPQKTSQVARRAIQQNLGFLGMLGRKDLTKALGGAPTALKDASPGAGAGGKEGSGGELLVGLGQGVKRTTVGNSGVAGLGGIGSKGAGGGAGGYGNSMIGSGEGHAISSIPLSQDIVLEGGLDRSVIQATIAKYLSQVRACYEEGLRKNPGISGQVTMGFEIGGSGSLNFARVAKSSLGNSEVEGCISARMMGWKFPKPLGGVNVKVNYPFLLRPVGT